MPILHLFQLIVQIRSVLPSRSCPYCPFVMPSTPTAASLRIRPYARLQRFVVNQIGQRKLPLLRIASRSLRYPQLVPGDMSTWSPCSCHVSLMRFVSTRAAFAQPGPSCQLFPDFLALIRPSDFLSTFGLQLRFPSPSAYLLCWQFILRRATRTPADALPLEIDYRLSVPPECC